MKKFLNKHTALMLAVVIIFTTLLTGCQFLTDLFNPFSAEFKANSLNFTLGESKEITFDDFTYKGNSSSVSYAISTSNDEVIAISGHTLNAVGEGSRKITVSFSNGDSAKADAFVSKVANSLTLKNEKVVYYEDINTESK